MEKDCPRDDASLLLSLKKQLGLCCSPITLDRRLDKNIFIGGYSLLARDRFAVRCRIFEGIARSRFEN